jgi:hypothetical protein
MSKSCDLRWPLGPRQSSQRWVVELLATHPAGLTVDQLVELRSRGHRAPNLAALTQGLRRLRIHGFAGRRFRLTPPFYIWLLSPAGFDLVKKEPNGRQTQG